MKIDIYSNMYNEKEILPFWLRHYETFADRIFVWDGGSTDGTLEMLKKHPKVILLPRDQRGHDDNYYVNKLYPQYKEHSRGVSDWVIVVDADEFIYHPKIREILENFLKIGVEIVQCGGYAMISDEIPVTDKQIYEVIKMGVGSYSDTKWTIHLSKVDVLYRKGRHSTPFNFRGNYVNSRYRYHGIKLLHYRYLGEKYIREREERNVEQVRIVYPDNMRFVVDGARSMPDGDQTLNIFDWLEKNKDKFINVMDI